MTKKHLFNNEIRTNWGYWDGRLAAELKQPYRYHHFDKSYLAGWQQGYEERKGELAV